MKIVHIYHSTSTFLTKNDKQRVVHTSTTFSDKGNILISRDTNYTQPLQLCNTLMAVRMHPAKKRKKETKKRKDPLWYSSPSSNNTSTTKTTPELQALQERRLQKGNSAQAPSSPDQRSWVFTLKIVPALKTMPSTRTLPGTTN
jgi:hypothetical protein